MPRLIYRMLMIVLVILCWTGIVFSQDSVTPTVSPTNTHEAESEIVLIPFTMPFADAEISGVLPADWDAIQPGTAVRDDGDGINATYLVHIAAPDASLDETLEPLLPSLQLQTLPEALATYEGQFFTWTLYDVAYQPSQLEGNWLQVLMATAETDEGAYIIVLQAYPDEFDELYETVLKPALDTFGLPMPEIRQYLELSDFETVIIEEYAVQVDVPAQWMNANPGAYMRADSETDFTTLLVQTSLDLDEREFAELLLESLGLSALPEAGEALSLGGFDWTLYRIDFDVAEIAVTLHVATATSETHTILVGLLSSSEESPVLLDTVLYPVLSSIEIVESE
jgi:hypothetical protein